MSIEIITDFRVLMQKAAALNKAEQNGNASDIAAAKADHDAYKELCLQSKRMNLGVPYGDL